MSVRQRAVDLLYAMCDKSNAEEIVSEMLQYLESADYSIREEMVSEHFNKELHKKYQKYCSYLSVVWYLLVCLLRLLAIFLYLMWLQNFHML